MTRLVGRDALPPRHMPNKRHGDDMGWAADSVDYECRSEWENNLKFVNHYVNNRPEFLEIVDGLSKGRAHYVAIAERLREELRGEGIFFGDEV